MLKASPCPRRCVPYFRCVGTVRLHAELIVKAWGEDSKEGLEQRIGKTLKTKTPSQS